MWQKYLIFKTIHVLTTVLILGVHRQDYCRVGLGRNQIYSNRPITDKKLLSNKTPTMPMFKLVLVSFVRSTTGGTPKTMRGLFLTPTTIHHNMLACHVQTAFYVLTVIVLVRQRDTSLKSRDLTGIPL